MKTFLVHTIVLAWGVLALARSPWVVDPAIKVPVSTLDAGLKKIKNGMTREQVEEVLDPDWEVLSGSGGAGKYIVHYWHHKFPGYGFHIVYQMIASESQLPTLEDPVASVGSLYRFDRQPVK